MAYQRRIDVDLTSFFILTPQILHSFHCLFCVKILKDHINITQYSIQYRGKTAKKFSHGPRIPQADMEGDRRRRPT